jgi:hypothetical protein
MRIRERGEQNCSPLFLEQFWLRLPRDLCGEAGVACSRVLGAAGSSIKCNKLDEKEESRDTICILHPLR